MWKRKGPLCHSRAAAQDYIPHLPSSGILLSWSSEVGPETVRTSAQQPRRETSVQRERCVWTFRNTIWENPISTATSLLQIYRYQYIVLWLITDQPHPLWIHSVLFLHNQHGEHSDGFFWQLLEVILTSFSLKWTDPYEVHLALRVCNTGSQSAVILPTENSA